eukprot:2637702-Rhodomonas_salina.1
MTALEPRARLFAPESAEQGTTSQDSADADSLLPVSAQVCCPPHRGRLCSCHTRTLSPMCWFLVAWLLHQRLAHC